MDRTPASRKSGSAGHALTRQRFACPSPIGEHLIDGCRHPFPAGFTSPSLPQLVDHPRDQPARHPPRSASAGPGTPGELTLANTHDGLAAARARGRVGGQRPKLSPDQAALAQQQYDAGEKTVQQIADLFGVPRSTVYGYLNRPAGNTAAVVP